MEDAYQLRWKGRVTGPYRLDDIRALLAAGEISRAHQIEAAGGWEVLDEFLRAVDAPVHPPAMAGPSSLPHQGQLKPLRNEQEGDTGDPARIKLELLAEQARSRGLQHQYEILREQRARDHEKFLQPAVRRISPLAVLALLASLCNFLPILNLVAWLPSFILADLALSAMGRDHNLDGRGLVRASFSFTCLGLVLGLLSTLGWGFRWLSWW